jgi:hypothetical protein
VVRAPRLCQSLEVTCRTWRERWTIKYGRTPCKPTSELSWPPIEVGHLKIEQRRVTRFMTRTGVISRLSM